jgi:arylsulfatase A-like enzyme
MFRSPKTAAPTRARPGRSGRPSSPRRLLLGLLLLLFLVGVAAGCRRSEAGAVEALRPSPAGRLRAASQRQSFDGEPTGVQVGPGWYRPEPVWGSGSEERRGVAWSGPTSEIYFAVPPYRDAELVALGLPLIYPQAPPQRVTARLNGYLLGTFAVPRQWTELRIPLPARALVSPVNALVLTFAHAAVPAEIGLGGDRRRLAAVFDTLAVLPRGAPLAVEDGRRAAVLPAAFAETPDLQVQAPAPRRPAAGGRPDVFIYLIDALRADSLGTYGSRLPITPRIDAFAREAVVFERARSPASWTLPATFSVLSGRYPFHHGVHVPGDRLPTGAGPWLPALLERAGYETLGISQWMLGGDAFGLERGFGSFLLNVYENGKVPSSAARWFLAESLRRPRQPERPLFAFLHTVDPHAPYEPADGDLALAAARPGRLPPDLYNPQIFLARGLGRDPADVAHLRGLYDGEVQAADREFGAFLDLLRVYGLYDESLVVLVADHGEEFGEHGGFDHGRTLFDELLRVPLVVKFPRSLGIAPRRAAMPASGLDVPPTVLAAIGRAPVPGFDGVDLLAALRPGAPPSPAAPPRVLYAETRVDKTIESEAVDLTAVVVGDLKCIGDPAGRDQSGRPVPAVRAYDLARDPGERAPLPAGGPGPERCRAELARLAARARAEAPAAVHRDVPPEEAARLRALGYLR